MNSEKLYIAQEDLYRLGNAMSSRITAIRPSEINTVEINGITTIVADNNGDKFVQ